uniref:Uncharacterized protein n=1 Tax=Romanomermis culicivorax TaxID=13658 RepID=A0A915HXH7_ROMCU
MLKRLPSSTSAYGDGNSLENRNVAFIQSVSTQTDSVTVDSSTSNDNIRFTQPDYVRPVIEECFEELEDKLKPTFYHFCSQILTLLHEQSDKIELINRQSILVEKLMQENKELKKRLDRLETMRFGC